ncbi:EAL domain-containing protein [Actinoplanes sp. NPDC051633]|uniref:putative bifunctional diguanylate cyclase/phosphodiesterase n=1 Tax=Actinoplanes sp. NPDC051633 TaxID=3155670 RepID=UPI00344218EC
MSPPWRVPAPLLGGFALLAVTYLWFLVGLGHQWHNTLAGWAPLPAGAVLAAYTGFAVFTKRSLPADVRRFWLRVAVTCLILAAATAANALDAFGGGTPSQRLGPTAAALYVTVLGGMVWSLLRLPVGRRSAGEWTRFGLDVGIILLTSGVLMWQLSLRSGRALLSQTGSLVPILCLITIAAVSLTAAIKVAFGGAGGLDRVSLRWLALGLALALTSGAMMPLLHGRPHLSTTLLAIPVVAVFTQIAAYRQLRAPATPEPVKRARRGFSVLPYLGVAGMDAVLLGSEITRTTEGKLIAGSTVALTALAMLRQILVLRDNGRLLTTVDANLREMRDYQRRLDHQITHDTLTETANRTLFAEKVTERLAAGETFHVALLDLDDFKEVNDRLGHGTGDALLKAVSRRLTEALRPADVLARLGGDEFTILFSGDPAALLQRLVDHVQRPLLLDGNDLAPRISVGVTESAPGDSPEEVMRRADVAMYAAKSAGGSRWAWYDPIMDQLADMDAMLSADLRQAIVRGELSVVYQPIVELPHGRVIGVEALVRWHRASPAVFIPLAERSGFIVELGRWVLEQVVAQAAAWPMLERISVNISARQLQEPGFAASVAALLDTWGVEPSRLVAEVTETAVLGSGLDAVRELHDLGLQVALDDFGTGQSSLSLLVSCPVNILKVDKSFVDGVSASTPQAVIVEGLIGITDGLGVQAVAEGVETAAQAERLAELGYRYAQGFHFARPMPPAEIDALLMFEDSRIK